MDGAETFARDGELFASRLRQLRLSRALTQEELAERAGVSVRAISDLERGLRRTPRRDTVGLLTKGLDLSEAERAALEAAIGPRARSAASRPLRTDLPVRLTPFVGRERETAALTALLRDPQIRLLVLTGPGGVGKTRLALQVAGALRDQRTEVLFVPLAGVAAPSLLVATVAAALGVRETGERLLEERLAEALRRQRFVLILDSFERLTAAAATVADLIARCSCLKVLVTSRAVLGVSGEQIFPVPPLSLRRGVEEARSREERAVRATHASPLPASSPRPEGTRPLDSSEAVQLFVARARAADPEFRLTEANADAVAEICARLDGLPLAIELAAARVRLLPPAALATRLTHRLELLTGGPQDQPPRLQTLRDAIAWSYDLLDPEEQAIFRRLSVFVGGFTLDTAESVSRGIEESRNAVGATHASPVRGLLDSSPARLLDSVMSLIDKSLVTQREGSDGEPRYRMLETIREFAWERLVEAGEAAAVRTGHAVAFMSLVEAAERELNGPRQGAWLRRFDAEHGNLRAALAWTLEESDGLADVGLRLAAGLWRFWTSRGLLREGTTWLERALAAPAAVPLAVRATALKGQGNLAIDLSDLGRARELYAASLSLYRQAAHPRGVAAVLSNLGLVGLLQGDLGSARARFEESLRITRQAGEQAMLPLTLCDLGQIEIAEGHFAAAERLGDEAYAISHEAGDTRAIAYACEHRGLLAYHRGEDEAALRWFEEGLGHARDLGDLPIYAYLLQSMSRVAVRQGRVATAAHLIGEALAIRQEMRSRRVVAECLDTMAEVALAGNRLAFAARLLGVAATLRERLQEAVPPIRRASHHDLVAALRTALGDETFEAEHRFGRQLPTEEAMVDAVRLADELGRQRSFPAAKPGIDDADDDLVITLHPPDVAEPLPTERFGGGMAKA